MAKQKNQPMSDEERERRRAEQRALVRASVEQLRCSDGWRAYLRARRAFHCYSLGNVLLILQQHPTATRVAGFGAWLKLGYCVSKGSQAIRIWAPCPPTRKQLQEWKNSGASLREKPPIRWRLACVFAQDQVAPLPAPAQPAPLEAPGREIRGASHEQLIDPLIQLAGEVGYTVAFASTPRGDGYCAPKVRHIVIAERLESNARLAVLIHELGHALLREEPGAEAMSYAQEELVVESIAHIACDLVGLDTSANSIPYLASWAETASVEILEQTAELTDRLARRIEDRLLAADAAALEPGQEQPLDPPQPMAA